MKNELSADDAISKFFQNPQRMTQVLQAERSLKVIDQLELTELIIV